MRRIFFVIIFVLLLALVFLVVNKKALAPDTALVQNNDQNIQVASSTLVSINDIAEPIAGALARVTKKPFGLKVSPTDSPVSPERFSGYHTGVDFETSQAEQNIEVPIYAICSGKLLLKKQATGYGGVAVQACEINKQSVTVLYGHLKLSSITSAVSQELSAGQQLAVLGQGYSSETDGERKHLHLSIHYGQQIVLLGYVQKQADLSAWLDPMTLLQK